MEIFRSSRVLGAYRRNSNLKDSLVHSNLQSSMNTGDDSNGTFPCRRPRCKTCAYTNSAAQINTPGGPLTIRQKFACTTSNLIYIITCRTCTLCYIGETMTGRKLGDRFCEHLRSVKKKADLPVAKHFSSPRHTTDYMMVVSTGLRDTAQRRSAEGRMIFKCQTLQPRGMNKFFVLFDR